MPGASCSIFGCNSNRKNSRIGIMKVPSGDDDFNKKWREQLINIVTRDHVVDASLKIQIEKNTIRICEKHFHPSQLNYHKGRRTMKPGSIPYLNLPEKSIFKTTSMSIIKMPCKVNKRRPNSQWITKTRVHHKLPCKVKLIGSLKQNICVASKANLLGVKQKKNLSVLTQQEGLQPKALSPANKTILSTTASEEKLKNSLGGSMIKTKLMQKKKTVGSPTQAQQGKVPRTPEGQEPVDEDKLNDGEMFDWNVYLKKTDALSAPQSAFAHVQPLEHCCFEPGMKLECPNKDGSGTFWLATIITKAAPLVLLRYEGYESDNSDDFWINVVTDDIHPVGWCSRTKHSLRPPRSIQHKQKDWYQYLIKHLTGARKAADSLFKLVSSPLSDLKAGLLVEVIDLQDPKRYWYASITEVYAGRLRLQYKGIADSDGEVWLYYSSERLQAVGEGVKKQMTVAPPGALLLKISNDVWPNPKAIDKWQCHEASECLQDILKDPIPLRTHSFQVGMKLEAKHPRDPSRICVATIARVYDEHHFLVRIDNLLCTAYREGENSVVCHRDSHGIYPIGWCHKNGVTLHPPKGYNGHFTWNSYLKYCKAAAAPEACFDLEQVGKTDHGFKLGMKLEAVDQEEPSRICVATITFIVGRTMWVTLDGESRSEQIFDALSYDIFPAGWCSATGHELQWPRPDTIEQKNRISRLRVTSDRITRLETLRKGRFKRQNSFSGGSNENSDHESPVPKKSKKIINARYVRGRKQIKSKEATEVLYNVLDRRYIDPTMPYVCIHEIAQEFNTEEQIHKSFNLDADGNLPKVVVTLDSDDEDKEKVEDETKVKFENQDLHFLAYLGIKPNQLSKDKEDEFYVTKPPVVEDDDEVKATIVKMPARPNKGSLDSIVAMLRNNSKPKLLDSFRKEKSIFLPNGKIQLCVKHMHQYVKKVDIGQQHLNAPHTSVSNGSFVRTKSSMMSAKNSIMNNSGDRINKNRYPAFVGKNLRAVGVDNVVSRSASKGSVTPCRTMTSVRRERNLQAPSSKAQVTRVTRNKENVSNGVVSTSQDHRLSNGQQYRVVQNFVSDDGPTNKIVIKLARPGVSPPVANTSKISTSSSTKPWEQPSDCPLVISDVRSVAVSDSGNPVTSTDNSATLSSSVSTATIADDREKIEEDIFSKESRKEVQKLCNDLPKNAQSWTKHDVAKFIGLADCQPYARIFIEQDVDGPAFLLLTIHEIHKILGVTLGPALKLADYIKTLKKISEEYPRRSSLSS